MPAGTTVHDQATVTGQAGLPPPTGTVTFEWFTNGTCTGSPAATSSPFTLNGLGVRGRDDVHADAEHLRDVRVPGDLLG